MPLSASFPAPGQEFKARLCVVCRSEPLVPPDPTVLSQLLTIRPENELGVYRRRSCVSDATATD